ncbi:hypothetical protein GCM10010317_065400 [Streptomyces mirabilis]|nr:hypothetical protein GCM10010317_065400 [Streptomyces mirabilis]
MQQPPCRARDERLELPGAAGVLERAPFSHHASRPRTTLTEPRARPCTTGRTVCDKDPVSYEARRGPAVKSPVGTHV